MHTSLEDRFKFISPLGSGSFGAVYLVVERFSGRRLALKIESDKNKNKLLMTEIYYLLLVRGIPGLPFIVDYGKAGEWTFMAIDLRAETLEDRSRKEDLSVPCIMRLTAGLIKVLSLLHGRGIVHRDLKPENMAFGLDKDSKKVFLLDFGLAGLWFKNNKHVTDERIGFVGTVPFASKRAHKGLQHSPRDDLEGLMYTIMVLFKDLPWMHESNIRKVGEMKEKFLSSGRLNSLPKPLVKCYLAIQKIGFYDTPDYQCLIDLLLDRKTSHRSITNNQLDSIRRRELCQSCLW